ncbi:MAG: helix-turn-helix transcriptional regulator, partial [Clostridia bacterium]|nr:helix-turn-helix transcriptional regulator [Clostridia bacterium]
TRLLRDSVLRYTGRQERDRCGEILAYIENHPAEQPSLSALTSVFHYSEEHIIRMVKKRTGMSPHRYWVLRKLRHSCRDLELTSKSIAEIAREHGYEFPGSYTKEFRKNFGMTPKRYREVYGIILN